MQTEKKSADGKLSMKIVYSERTLKALRNVIESHEKGSLFFYGELVDYENTLPELSAAMQTEKMNLTKNELALLVSVRGALKYFNAGHPLKDFIDNDEIVCALRLLLKVMPPNPKLSRDAD